MRVKAISDLFMLSRTSLIRWASSTSLTCMSFTSLLNTSALTFLFQLRESLGFFFPSIWTSTMGMSWLARTWFLGVPLYFLCQRKAKVLSHPRNMWLCQCPLNDSGTDWSRNSGIDFPAQAGCTLFPLEHWSNRMACKFNREEFPFFDFWERIALKPPCLFFLVMGFFASIGE